MRFSLFYLLWSLKMSYLCLSFLLYILVWRKKLVISNHFGIVRLKTQSEKYMALKDDISTLVFLLKKSNHFFVMFWRLKEFSSYTKRGFSRGVMWLRYMPQRLHLFCLDDKKKLKTKHIVLKRICEFSPGTPVSTHKESWQGSLGYKKITDLQKAF